MKAWLRSHAFRIDRVLCDPLCRLNPKCDRCHSSSHTVYNRYKTICQMHACLSLCLNETKRPERQQPPTTTIDVPPVQLVILVQVWWRGKGSPTRIKRYKQGRKVEETQRSGSPLKDISSNHDLQIFGRHIKVVVIERHVCVVKR